MDRPKDLKEIAYENSQYERLMQDFQTRLDMRSRMEHLHELRMKLPTERSKNVGN